MKRLICFFIGHKIDPFVTGWYDRCTRCEAHEYYDGHPDNPFLKQRWYHTIPNIVTGVWYSLRWRLERFASRWVFKKCHDCNKTEMIFGKPVGEHRGCLPF